MMTPTLQLPPSVALNEKPGLFELVDGEIVRKTVGAAEIAIANLLKEALTDAVRTAKCGRTYVEMGFAMANGNGRKPDVAFLSYQSWARNRRIPPGDYMPVAPDLAIEIISPNELTMATVYKVQEYFESGVKQVWLVFSNIEQVYCYTSPTNVRILTREDEISGDALISGFRMAVADLFPPVETDHESNESNE